jgi:hypothetical protein
MRVLAGPRLDLAGDPCAADVCRRLAGEQGTVVPLTTLGLQNPYRPLSAAEVAAFRSELQGSVRDGDAVVGYVCRGVPAPGGQNGWIAVTDHADLTWRSPLTGPNDDQAGPRFPGMHGVYAPDRALALGSGQDGIVVVPGVVAGVSCDLAMSEYEIDMVTRLGWAAASSELVAPVVLAAHMGLRVAGVVMAVAPDSVMSG